MGRSGATSWYARSVLAPAGVVELVHEQSGLEVTGCELVRSLVNDVYALDTTSGGYAFKLYRQVGAPRARSRLEVGWEQQLASELIRAGLAVPAPVTLSGGALVGELLAPEGPRPYALTHWVAGTKPVPPWTDELYRTFGALTGQFHDLAVGLAGGEARTPVDPVEELAATAAEVAGVLGDPDDRELVRARAGWAGQQLDRLTRSGMTSGVRHGDVTLDNVLLTPAGLALHDLDRSGPGWLAADLTGVRQTDHWPAFLAGYRRVRPVTAADVEALPALQVVALVDNLRFHLVDKPQVFGTESRAEGWVERELASLRALRP